MSSPEAAAHAAAPKATSLAALLSPARAAASRKNGAKSRGPKTPAGKARASRNALKHGLRAEQFIVVEGESAEAFAAFEAALACDLAPEGALQAFLAGRITRAAWRLQRSERIEAELFAREMAGPFGDGDLGLALIRDGNGARAFNTLLRYRASAQAEFSRALRLLEALQADAALREAARYREVERSAPPRAAERPDPASYLSPEPPNKPEARGNPDELRRESGRIPSPESVAIATLAATPRSAPAPAPEKQPDEPESPENPRDSGRPAAAAFRQWLKSASALSQTAEPGLAGTALASRRPGGTTANGAAPRC